jgi:hypothetical protein
MIKSSSSHFDSTNNVSMFSFVHRSSIHLRRDLVELVASRIAIRPFPSANHLHMSFTAASAAALRSRSPSGLVVSKNSAEGFGVAVRRYWPTLNVFAFIDSQCRYRTTTGFQCQQQLGSCAKRHTLPFCAIRLLPRAGKPTITTHIRVSSAWTPTPLVFLCGCINSPVGTLRMLGEKTPLVSAMISYSEP